MNIQDCPKCGKPDSAFEGTFCGPCEQEYHNQLDYEKESEIAELRMLMGRCTCPEGCCTSCIWNQAKVYELQGRYNDAASLMNQ